MAHDNTAATAIALVKAIDQLTKSINDTSDKGKSGINTGFLNQGGVAQTVAAGATGAALTDAAAARRKEVDWQLEKFKALGGATPVKDMKGSGWDNWSKFAEDKPKSNWVHTPITPDNHDDHTTSNLTTNSSNDITRAKGTTSGQGMSTLGRLGLIGAGVAAGKAIMDSFNYPGEASVNDNMGGHNKEMTHGMADQGSWRNKGDDAGNYLAHPGDAWKNRHNLDNNILGNPMGIPAAKWGNWLADKVWGGSVDKGVK